MSVDEKIGGAPKLGSIREGVSIPEAPASIEAPSSTPALQDLSPLIAEVTASIEAGSMDALEALQGLVKAHVSGLQGPDAAPLPTGFVEEIVAMISEDPLLTDLLQAAPVIDNFRR
jgi:hypothetical protein